MLIVTRHRHTLPQSQEYCLLHHRVNNASLLRSGRRVLGLFPELPVFQVYHQQALPAADHHLADYGIKYRICTYSITRLPSVSVYQHSLITVEMSAAESTDNGVTSEPVKQIEIMDPTEGQDSML
jgi:hypothetical protein